MKVLQINTVCGKGSTGTIVVDLYNQLLKMGNDAGIAYGRGAIKPNINAVRICSFSETLIHAGLSRITDRQGFYSLGGTEKLIKWIEQYEPDIIHLHNLHGYYLDIRALFRALKRIGIPIVWTLHDCWAFTGHCVHYDSEGCSKWKIECHNCTQLKTYPSSWIMDASNRNYREKQECFRSAGKMHLITPSLWLAKQVEVSFLRDFPLTVIYNGIDTNVFRPCTSYIKEKYHIENKKLLLGVANVWDMRKGLNRFICLSKLISAEYQIILVGLSENQIGKLPPNIIGVTRTSNVQELVELYSAAHIYINTSIEETMGLTTAEALACGTPVIVYNRTAIPEIVGNSNCGIVIEPGDGSELLAAVRTLEDMNITAEDCRKRALEFEKEKQYCKYIDIYNKILYGI